ncbi:hypothetical protein HRM2_05350 [Desulforapulum autotrophicum HRM2]|uniref:Uncharacterized protein n=1 Tax=Desulforapulum autotrophicum (strain ATCC 43914 / DSM 3382 / VKM B-1955 / HRM2) TaxID=177437 RepID=C0QHU1_DESAH|nr:hypothetical protein HRM2_05350 [Desulforapulum autotrophicum HRM2]
MVQTRVFGQPRVRGGLCEPCSNEPIRKFFASAQEFVEKKVGSKVVKVLLGQKNGADIGSVRGCYDHLFFYDGLLCIVQDKFKQKLVSGHDFLPDVEHEGDALGVEPFDSHSTTPMFLFSAGAGSHKVHLPGSLALAFQHGVKGFFASAPVSYAGDGFFYFVLGEQQGSFPVTPGADEGCRVKIVDDYFMFH